MRKALGVLVCLVSAITVVGCGAGEIAEKATGFEVTHTQQVYAPTFACDEVKGQLDKGGLDAHVYYRVECLPRTRFILKMAKACKSGDEDAGKAYWIAYKGKVGYLRCKEFEEAAMRQTLEEVKAHQGEYERGKRKLP